MAVLQVEVPAEVGEVLARAARRCALSRRQFARAILAAAAAEIAEVERLDASQPAVADRSPTRPVVLDGGRGR